MILTVDLGNSNIVFGVFENENLKKYYFVINSPAAIPVPSLSLSNTSREVLALPVSILKRYFTSTSQSKARCSLEMLSRFL